MKTTQEILKDAANMDEVPPDYDLLAINFFYIIKNLLTLFKMGKLTKEQAGNIKQKAIQEYEKSKEIYQYNLWDNKDKEPLINMLREALKGESLPEALSIAVELVERYSGESFDYEKNS